MHLKEASAKTDVGIAKNYLNEKELNGLNRIVTMYLDFAENQALKSIVMNMKDWIIKLDAFLQFNEEAVLKHQGKVSHEVALALAESVPIAIGRKVSYCTRQNIGK